MSAVASSTAAASATPSRSLRLRDGSISLNSGRRTRLATRLPGARMPVAWPWREQQDQPRVVHRPNLVALVRVEVDEEAGPAARRLAALLELDLPGRDHNPGALVHLVLLEALAGGQID